MENNSITDDKQRLTRNIIQAQGGKSPKEMAEILGVGLSTYYDRLKDPEKMKYEEIKRLCSKCNIDITQFVAGRVVVW